MPFFVALSLTLIIHGVRRYLDAIETRAGRTVDAE